MANNLLYPTSAKVNRPLYEGVLWAGVIAGACFVALRLWARLKTFKTLYQDDYLVLAAVIMFLISASLQQTQINHMYQVYWSSDFLTGKRLPDLAWLDGQSQLLHHLIAYNFLFYTGLWSVKFSFMIFFRRLGAGLSPYRYWWWTIIILCVASLITCIADIQWECLAFSVADNLMQYQLCGTPAKVSFQQITFQVNCALDVGTDILIITIPISLLWNRRISLRKKIVLIGLFSLTVLIMAIAIIRVTVVSSKNVPSDMTWLYFWTNIELFVALAISSFASFRQLYMSSQPEYSGQTTAELKDASFLGSTHRILRSGFLKITSSITSRPERSNHDSQMYQTERPTKISGESTELMNINP